MARIEGKDITAVTIVDAAAATRDFTTETQSVDFKLSKEQHDTTTLSQSWKTFTDGLKGGDDISWELFYNNTASTGVWPVLTGLFNNASPTNFVITDGVRTITSPVSIKNLSLPIKVNDMVKVTVSLQINGTVAFS